MSAEEMKEFLAAMELARQANMAWPEVARNFVEQDDDLDQDGSMACSYTSATIH